jgi:hypothetical protein
MVEFEIGYRKNGHFVARIKQFKSVSHAKNWERYMEHKQGIKITHLKQIK